MRFLALDAFRDYLKRDVVGVPTPVMERAMVDTAIEFCVKSKLWHHEMDAQTIKTGIADYTLDDHRYASIADVNQLMWNGALLTPFRWDELDRDYPHWRKAQGQADGYCFIERGEIRLTKIPLSDAVLALTGTLILKPKRGTDHLPEFLYEDWIVTLSAGARSSLHNMKAKDWTDENQATKLRNQFEVELNDARSIGIRAYSTKARVRTQARFF